MLDDRLRDISEIRNLMEESARFRSFSGLSSISAGLIALIGGWGAYLYLDHRGIYATAMRQLHYELTLPELLTLVGIALLMMVFAGGLASYFSIRLARKNHIPLWTPASKKLLESMAVPLSVGACFCIAIAANGAIQLIPSSTLLFYGLALLNASKYTLKEVRLLAYIHLFFGALAAFLTPYALYIWLLSFGIVHILYGLIMYQKYER